MNFSTRKILAMAALVLIGAGVFFVSRSHRLPATGPEERRVVEPRHELQAVERPAQGGVVHFSKLEQFRGWSDQYLLATATGRESMKDEGLALAKARRPEFLKLIKADPARALKEAVPMVVRQDLPAKVVAQLEERVRGVGELRTYAGTALPDQANVNSVHYLELRDGTTYEAHTFGREEGNPPLKANRSVNGVAIAPDRGMAQLALDPSPIRPLEIGERPDSSLSKVQICPISGNSTAVPPDQANAPVTADTPVVEAQGSIVLPLQR